MAKSSYKKGRKIYNLEETVGNMPGNLTKGAKPKVKASQGSEIGSGMFRYQNGGNMLKKCQRLPDIGRLENDVLQCIIGQDKQVRQIITAIYRAINFRSIKSNVLIIGNSGTGKTATIEQIAKRLHMPYTIEDATKYTQEGYYGADVNDMIYNLLENSHYDFERAQNGIIIIDEIDKKAGHGEHDVSGVEVLKSLLKINRNE